MREAYDAVYEVLRADPGSAEENARVWRAVAAALDALSSAGRLQLNAPNSELGVYVREITAPSELGLYEYEMPGPAEPDAPKDSEG